MKLCQDYMRTLLFKLIDDIKEVMKLFYYVHGHTVENNSERFQA